MSDTGGVFSAKLKMLKNQVTNYDGIRVKYTIRLHIKHLNYLEDNKNGPIYYFMYKKIHPCNKTDLSSVGRVENYSTTDKSLGCWINGGLSRRVNQGNQIFFLAIETKGFIIYCRTT